MKIKPIVKTPPTEMREKDIQRLAEKIETAVNQLSLENYIDTPDFIIGQTLANIFNEMVKQHQLNKKWHGIN